MATTQDPKQLEGEANPKEEENYDEYNENDNDYDGDDYDEEEGEDYENEEDDDENREDFDPEKATPDNWEQLLENPNTTAPQNQGFQQPPTQIQPPVQQTQQEPPAEEKPKKKMMKLNVNSTAFVPGGGFQPQQDTNSFQPFQPSGGFYGAGAPNQFMGNPYMGGPYGQYPSGMRPGGGMPWQQPGGPWGGPQFNQQDFPAYQGAPFNPPMTFNNDSGMASFNRKPVVNQDPAYEEENEPIDRELLKEIRKQRNKEKKKLAAQNDPNKGKEQKPKAPREFKKPVKNPVKKVVKPKAKEEVDNTLFSEVDEERAPINLVFIGHVDVGKSTICGSILLATGRVDKNELRKLELEAKEKKRESWYLAYIMDINEEERSKGKTVEVGKAHFQTKTKRFTILDAPGHKNYVPNMIAGACQADYAALVISAKTGEFESGFEKGGQTREHAMLAKCLGVLKLIVIVNKMDEDNWSKARFDFIKEQISPFLATSCGFDLEKDVSWLPLSGLNGHNLNNAVPPEVCEWYKGPNFFEIVDSLPIPERNPNGPLRIPVLDKMRDFGVNIFGKIESGTLQTDMLLTLMPFKKELQVTHIFNTEDQRVKYAKPGENVRLKVKNVEEDDVRRGSMLCFADNECPVCFEFEAKLTILELPEHKPILSQGYKAIIHMHTIVEEIEVKQVMAIFDKENKQIKSHFLKNGSVGIARMNCASYLCLEKCEVNPHLGRFTLRDEGRTIALGEVVKIKVVKGAVQALPVAGSEKKIEEKKPEEERKVTEDNVEGGI